ncbi:MAG: hypothetical protein H6Q90_3745 [Deltaproteobacteria bacterium]|nr:hypothetical protein [Deltaproteobacteria bacterium]
MTNKQRRARDAALDRLLDDLDDQLYTQVVEAVDFARLDAIEQTLVLDLERLIAEGHLPAAPDRGTLNVRAAAMIANALYTVPEDPRRSKHPREDDCELCRMLGTGAFVS